jgi:hypothetical protein
MIAADKYQSDLIAPCGINCSICYAFLRQRNRCEGCRVYSDTKVGHCSVCYIKNCENLSANGSGFCFDCDRFPCKRLKQLDERYGTKYNMSVLENLNIIQISGLENFVQREKIRWKCAICGGSVCVHRGYCLDCNKKNSMLKK